MKYKKKELDTVELGEELLVCAEDGQRMHRLNSTAAAIWRLCNGQRHASEIAAHLARDFRGRSEKEIKGDVCAALQEMKEMGIVEVSP